MTQPKDLRVPILLLVPIGWMIFLLISDYSISSRSRAEVDTNQWDMTNLQILPHYSSPKDDLESVFNLEKIPVNGAGVDLLVAIPGIGPELANRIINDRNRSGPFNKPDELSRV